MDLDARETEVSTDGGGLAYRHLAPLEWEAAQKRVGDPLGERLDQAVLLCTRHLFHRAVDLPIVRGMGETVGTPRRGKPALEFQVDPNGSAHLALRSRDPECRRNLDPLEQDHVRHEKP